MKVDNRSVDKIVAMILTDRHLVKIHRIDENVLWGALHKLSAMVRDAKPFVEADEQMIADISRFAPLAPEEQARHDSTEYPSEIWLAEYKRITELA